MLILPESFLIVAFVCPFAILSPFRIVPISQVPFKISEEVTRITEAICRSTPCHYSPKVVCNLSNLAGATLNWYKLRNRNEYVIFEHFRRQPLSCVSSRLISLPKALRFTTTPFPNWRIYSEEAWLGHHQITRYGALPDDPHAPPIKLQGAIS